MIDTGVNNHYLARIRETIEASLCGTGIDDDPIADFILPFASADESGRHRTLGAAELDASSHVVRQGLTFKHVRMKDSLIDKRKGAQLLGSAQARKTHSHQPVKHVALGYLPRYPIIRKP